MGFGIRETRLNKGEGMKNNGLRLVAGIFSFGVINTLLAAPSNSIDASTGPLAVIAVSVGDPVKNADGSTSTTSINNDGSSTIVVVSADGNTTTTTTKNKDGSLAAVNPDGTPVPTTTITNADGSTTTTTTVDMSDAQGNIVKGTITIEISADGNTTKTIEPDGTISVAVDDGKNTTTTITPPDGGRPEVVVEANS